ncbi:MAG TPA: helix-turn-helix transcriptional regulator [Nocardioidaceae bacterium]|nr:helix-turn-helix transcriptional regulator [Nocardioidaceae bacterium]
MVIFRRLLGEVLRSQRMRQGLTLRQVSADARVSLGYISEVERGQKEASSELLAAICAALDVPLSEILSEVSDAVALEEAALAMQLESVELETLELPTATERGGDVVASAA